MTELLVRITVWLALGWLVALAVPKRNPRWEVLTLRLLTTGCLLLPLVYAIHPTWELAVLPTTPREAAPADAPSVDAVPQQRTLPNQAPRRATWPVAPEATVAATPSAPRESFVEPRAAQIARARGALASEAGRHPMTTGAEQPAASRLTPTFHDVAMLAWGAGACAMLLRLVALAGRTRAVLRKAAPASSIVSDECEQLAAEIGLRRGPAIRQSADVPCPCSAGWLRPVLLLPDGWDQNLATAERRAVLVHELSHIAGRDAWWDLAARLATCLWWFHPLAWRLVARHRLACEHRCDAVAAPSAGGMREYRQMLAGWTLQRRLSSAAPGVLAMASSSAIVRRIKRLEQAMTAARLRRGALAAGAAFAAVGLAVTASLELTPRVVAQVVEPASQRTPAASPPQTSAPNDPPAQPGNPGVPAPASRVVSVIAVGLDGEPVRNAVPRLEEDQVWTRAFAADHERPGLFRSPAVEPNRRWLRVFAAAADEQLLFSDLIDVANPPQVDDTGAIVAVLRPGVRLSGRLDDAVPRPVKNGCVHLCIKEAEGRRIAADTGWVWQDAAVIREDGSFEFPSVPGGGHAQLFALADGFHSRRPTVEELRTYLAEHAAGDVALIEPAISRDYWPQLVPLPAGARAVEAVLPCVPTAAADIRVVDPAGQPIAGATVKFSPNCFFLGGEVVLPGLEDYRAWARNDVLVSVREWANTSFYNVPTDADGLARVRNLPADMRLTCRVEANGFVVPSEPGSSQDFDARYALIESRGGETLRRTITMERLITRSARDLAVVDPAGRPVPEITVTVSELAFAGAEDDWQFWSVQRFGPIPTATSDAGGQMRLEIPRDVDGQKVAALRAIVAGRVGGNAYVQRRRVVFPPEDDGGVLVLTESAEAPTSPNAFREVAATYAALDELSQTTPLELLTELERKPSLATLKRLLATAGFEDATPLEFRPERNLLAAYGDQPSPIARVQCGGGERVVAMCYVRPRDATWDVKPPLRFPPEAAFVFDAADGSLVTMLGGWATSQGHYCSVMLTELGTAGDYFVETSAFETNGPFEYLQRWTRLGREDQLALTVLGYANATGWSADAHEGPLTAEFGYTVYEFNSRDIDERLLGVLPNGTPAPRKIYWDGRLNKFIGPATMSYEGTPLFQVDTDHSAAFEPLAVEPGQLLVAGGRRSFENWHAWDVVVPGDRPATLTVSLTRETPDGVEELKSREWPLPAAQHLVQLHVDFDAAAGEPDLEVRVNEERTEVEFDVPLIEFAKAPSLLGKPVVRAANQTEELMRYPTADPDVWLTARVSIE